MFNLFKKKAKPVAVPVARKDWDYDFRNSTYEATSGDIFFHIAGAGKIAISKQPRCSTGCYQNGGAAGFNFGVSWGRHGYAGGVLGQKEAKRLAEHILEALKNATETEDEIMQKNEERYQKMFAEHPELKTL